MQTAISQSNSHITSSKKVMQTAFAWVIFIFFIWGFLSSLNDILIPHLKKVFALSYLQAMLIQFCFFLSYFLMSIPAGRLVQAKGYRFSMVAGLVCAAVGCVLFIPASRLLSYPLFLFALFVLAAGLTQLQVAANPYVALLGSPQGASARLNLSQGFNSVGTTIAPLIGAALILCTTCKDAISEARAVELPYALLALTLVAIAVIFYKINIPDPAEADTAGQSTGSTSILKLRNLRLGIVSIFFDVGAEVTIGSFMVSFLTHPEISHMSVQEAGRYISLYWGGAMVGRFIGSALLQKISAQSLLAINGAAAIVAIVLAVIFKGNIAVVAMVSIGLFNSILFANNFSLSLKHTGAHTTKASSYLVMAIVGGAVIPLLQGLIADSADLFYSYIVPLVCYVYIIFYGLNGYKTDQELTGKTSSI